MSKTKSDNYGDLPILPFTMVVTFVGNKGTVTFFC